MKLWRNKNWMVRKYITEKMTEEEIAKEAGTTQKTINEWLKKHGIHRSQR